MDRDETSPEEIEIFRKKYFSKNPKRLFYFSKRQVESYLIVDSAIEKLILNKIGDDTLLEKFKKENIEQKLFELADLQKVNIRDNYIEELFIKQSLITIKDIRNILVNFQTRPLSEIIDDFAAELSKFLTKKTFPLSREVKSVVDLFEEEWKEKEKRLSMCDGKELLKDARKWLTDEYKISFSNDELIDSIDTPHNDIKELISTMSNPIELLVKK